MSGPPVVYKTYGVCELWPLEGDTIDIDEARRLRERMSEALRKSMEQLASDVIRGERL